MERTAKQILHERKLEKNAKRYQSMLRGEDLDRRTRFESEDVKRYHAKKVRTEFDDKKDSAGYQRYGIDMRATEKRIIEIK